MCCVRKRRINLRLIYRGDQENMIKRLANIVGDNPTDMVFKVLSRLDNEKYLSQTLLFVCIFI